MNPTNPPSHTTILAGILLSLLLLLGCGRGDNRRNLTLSGTLEATEVVIRSEVEGKVVRLAVDQGDTVQLGQLLLTIDRRRLDIQHQELETDRRMAAIERDQARAELTLLGQQVQSRLHQAQANLEVARSRERLVESGTRLEEKARQREEVNEALAALEKARLLLERTRSLYARELVSRQQLDAAQSDYDQARARYANRQNLLKMAEAGSREEEVEAAKAETRRARAEHEQALADRQQVEVKRQMVEVAEKRVEKINHQLALLRSRLADTQLRAPIGATVAQRFVEPGEAVLPGMSLLSLYDLTNLWLWLYMTEKELGRIKLGDRVRVTVDAYADRPFTGEVVFISPQAEFTPKNIQTKEERVNLVFGVKVRVANREGLIKPGMPADGHFQLH